MTVNELLQQLVELAQRGRGTWNIQIRIEGCGESFSESPSGAYCYDETKEVVIE